MRIAICGAHGVGKTTISRILADEFNLEVLPDVAVIAYQKWFIINEETPIETQIWMTAKQLEYEKFTEKFVADKCIFDYHVYAVALGMHDHVNSITKMIALKNQSYNHVFYIHPEFPIEDDGVRSTNIEFQKSVDDYYKQFLIENDIPFTILTWSIEERKQLAISKINHIEDIKSWIYTNKREINQTIKSNK